MAGERARTTDKDEGEMKHERSRDAIEKASEKQEGKGNLREKYITQKIASSQSCVKAKKKLVSLCLINSLAFAAFVIHISFAIEHQSHYVSVSK